MRRRLLAIAFTLSLLLALPGEARNTFAQSAGRTDPAVYLLPPEDLPEGFEHQLQNDRTLTEPGIVRAVRFYTRGDPELPTNEHASILLAVSVSDSVQQAAAEFQQTIVTWTQLGYELLPLENEVGDEAVSSWDILYPGTDHPKEAALILFRRADVNATVQWTDDPGEVTLAHALAIARLMELRIAAASQLFAS